MQENKRLKTDVVSPNISRLTVSAHNKKRGFYHEERKATHKNINMSQ